MLENSLLIVTKAETNGGGLALWGSDGRFGKIRTSDENYYKGWLPFITEVGKIIAANQITNGGVSGFKRLYGSCKGAKLTWNTPNSP